MQTKNAQKIHVTLKFNRLAEVVKLHLLHAKFHQAKVSEKRITDMEKSFQNHMPATNSKINA